MKKNTIWLIVLISITGIFYIALASWLYYQNMVETTGNAILGILALALVFLFPAYALVIGVTGQIIFKKVWVSALINTVGVSIFTLTLLLSVKFIKPVVLIIIPTVFIITMAISFITKLIAKIFPAKNVAIESEVSEETGIDNK